MRRRRAQGLFSWLEIWQNFATFSALSPSHHIKCTKRHMFGAVNVGKKINKLHNFVIHHETNLLSLVKP
jgi:hypothetical protein